MFSATYCQSILFVVVVFPNPNVNVNPPAINLTKAPSPSLFNCLSTSIVYQSPASSPHHFAHRRRRRRHRRSSVVFRTESLHHDVGVVRTLFLSFVLSLFSLSIDRLGHNVSSRACNPPPPDISSALSLYFLSYSFPFVLYAVREGNSHKPWTTCGVCCSPTVEPRLCKHTPPFALKYRPCSHITSWLVHRGLPIPYTSATFASALIIVRS